MRLAYADPPYPGGAHLYRDHPDYGGEVDHAELLARLDGYDGWLLHTASTTLAAVLALAETHTSGGWRVMAWVKPFAAFKRNVSPAYAWEPVLVKPARPAPTDVWDVVARDWIAAPITLGRGLAGAKPTEVIRWGFAMLGTAPGDTLDDLYPGTGAVEETWQAWQGRPANPDQLSLLAEEVVA